MFIIVEDDIIRDSLTEDSVGSRYRLDTLVELSLSIRYGLHVVHIPILRRDKEVKAALKEILPARYYYALTRMNDSQSAHVISELVKTKIVLTADRKTVLKWQGQPVVVINISDYYSFRVLLPTFLITENLIDAKFYDSVVLYYKKKHNIKTANVSYIPIMGGGGSIASVICAINCKRQGVWLCIADSDKNYPDDTFGGTASQLLSEYMNLREPWGKCYVMQEVKEIENLIPITLLAKRKKVRGDFFNKDLSFYDVKIGLRYSILYDDNTYNYWKNIFPNAQSTKRNQIKKRSKDKNDYLKEVDKDNLITTCFGSHILSDVLDRDYYALNDVKESDLTCAQRAEWDAIGEVIFTWTCSDKPQRL